MHNLKTLEALWPEQEMAVPVERKPAGYVPEQAAAAAELVERLGKLNRKQRRSIIARVRKQARAAKGQKL